MLQVKRIINSIFTSNTYLLYDERYSYCWLIDIGDYAKVADALPQGVEIRGVFLTHTHFDHIYGLNELYNAWPKIIVYTSESGHNALYNDKTNLSRYHNCPIIYEGDRVKILGDGDIIELYPDIQLTSYATPGHSTCSLSHEVANNLFTGDAYIPGIKVVTKLPGGNRIIAKQSIEKILTLAKGRVVYPGHGDSILEA